MYRLFQYLRRCVPKMFDKSLDIITLVIIAVFFVLLGYRPPWWKKKLQECGRAVQDIPGPFSLPILGTSWVFSLGVYSLNKMHEFYEDMNKKFGPIVKEEALFNVPVISVFERRDIEKVLKSSGKYPIRPPTEAIAQYRRSRPDKYTTAGLVNEQGETWHYLRTTLTTDLTSPRTISSFLPQLNDIAEDWCNLIKQFRRPKDGVLELEQITGSLGLEAICALVLGRRMGFLLPEGQSESAKKLFEAVQTQFVAIRDTYFGLPLWKLFRTSSYKKLEESEETIYELILDLVKTADDATKESAIFQSILKADLDEREKTAAIVDFIAAGIHTLKNSVLFLLHLVAKHPEVQDQILQDTSKTYLKACVNETFRLMPTANCLARITEEELELGSYKVNAGSVVICQTGIACKDERNFYKAKEFRPERWLNDEKSITSSSSTFLVTPFGVGRRICPGKRFIEQVLPIILDYTVRNFEMQNETPLELMFEFLLTPKAPLCVSFKDRY